MVSGSALTVWVSGGFSVALNAAGRLCIRFLGRLEQGCQVGLLDHSGYKFRDPRDAEGETLGWAQQLIEQAAQRVPTCAPWRPRSWDVVCAGGRARPGLGAGVGVRSSEGGFF